MVHRPDELRRNGHLYIPEIGIWLGPECVEWYDRGDKFRIENGPRGYLIHKGEPVVVYAIEPTSETRH